MFWQHRAPGEGLKISGPVIAIAAIVIAVAFIIFNEVLRDGGDTLSSELPTPTSIPLSAPAITEPISDLSATPTLVRSPTPEPTPDFSFNTLAVSAKQVLAGDAVMVSARIDNRGGRGSERVSLLVDGTVVDTKETVLAAGTSTTVTFAYTPATAGQKQIRVGSLSGSITVVRPPAVSQLGTTIILTRGPYLGSCTSDSVILAWKTNIKGDSLVLYDTNPRMLRSVSYDPAEVTQHAVQLTGMSAEERYYYQVFIDGEPLTPAIPFKTNTRGHYFSFIAFGDSGTGGEQQYSVVEAMRGVDFDFAMVTGNVDQAGGAAENYDPHYFVPYKDFIRERCFWVSIGNHDVQVDRGKSLLDAFYLPSNNPQGTERYYSFDYGNAHLVVLDSYRPELNEEMLAWVTRDLAAADADPDVEWKLVFFHNPPYSSGLHGLNPQDPGRWMADRYVPLFQRYGVAMVFSGHLNFYERTCQFRRGECVSEGGIVYVVSGGGGAPLSPNICSGQCPWSKKFVRTRHFVRVEVNGDWLLFEAIQEGGFVMDSFVLETDDTEGNRTYRVADVELQADTVKVEHAFEVLKRHEREFLSLEGVVGTGLGVRENPNEAIIEVYAIEPHGVVRAALTDFLEGVEVEVIPGDFDVEALGKFIDIEEFYSEPVLPATLIPTPTPTPTPTPVPIPRPSPPPPPQDSQATEGGA